MRTSLPSEVAVNRINLNDQTVEGMRHKTKPIYLRAISSGSFARAARFDAAVRGVSQADREVVNPENDTARKEFAGKTFDLNLFLNIIASQTNYAETCCT